MTYLKSLNMYNKGEKLNIYVVGGSSYCAEPFSHIGRHVQNLDEADLMVFTGGADIDPSWYGCKEHPATRPYLERDIREVSEFRESLNYDRIKARIGYCRGAQLLGALSGAKLVQDVTHHCSTHNMVNAKGEELSTLSLHHQMVYPFDMPKDEYEILYWANPRRSHHYFGDKIDPEKVVVEPEVIWFPKTKSFGIQGHPEMMDKNHKTVIALNKLLIELIYETA